VSPGKFLVLFAGGEAEVEEAFVRGKAVAEALLIDQLHLPDAHPDLLTLLDGAERPLLPDEALLVNEYGSVGSALTALDAALKAAAVEAKKLHVARGIGGKAYWVVGGALHDVLAAADAAAGKAGAVLHSEQIARLSPDIRLEHL
jgi:microcompartment protein CcmL/EutN